MQEKIKEETLIPKFLRIMTRFRDAISTLADDEAGELLKQMLRFAASEPLKGWQFCRAKVAFEFLKPEIQADIEQKQRITAARVEAGRKGGQQKAANASEKQNHPTNTKGKSK